VRLQREGRAEKRGKAIAACCSDNVSFFVWFTLLSFPRVHHGNGGHVVLFIGFNSGKWQLRHFRLFGDRVDYAKTKEGSAKGSIPLAHSRVEMVEAGSQIGADALALGTRPKQPLPEHAFRVSLTPQPGQSNV
jgi:hypothetical protein